MYHVQKTINLPDNTMQSLGDKTREKPIKKGNVLLSTIDNYNFLIFLTNLKVHQSLDMDHIKLTYIYIGLVNSPVALHS